MRILIVAPWFRTLAHLYGRLLTNVGHEVLVIASDRQFEAGYGFCDEIVFGGLGNSALTGNRIVRTVRAIRKFAPEVVIEEPFTHPRWLPLPGNTRRILMLHEPVPGRDSVRLDRKRRLVAHLQGREISSVICFSKYAASIALDAGWRQVDVVPLISELPEEWVPDFKESRHGFAVVGRISRNKGIDLAVDAWQELDEDVKAREPLRLILSEGKDQSTDIDRWRRNGVSVHIGRFSFREIVNEISRSRVMLLPYRSAMQSGQQLLAMQLGLVTIVSDMGGLPEYQPDFLPAVTSLDRSQWKQRMLIEIGIDDSSARSNKVREDYLSRFGNADTVVAAMQYAIAPRHKVLPNDQ